MTPDLLLLHSVKKRQTELIFGENSLQFLNWNTLEHLFRGSGVSKRLNATVIELNEAK